MSVDEYDVHVTVDGGRGSITYVPYAGQVSEEGTRPEELSQIARSVADDYRVVFPDAFSRPQVHIRIVLR